MLAHIADGASNRQIADRMGLAEKTVRNYVSNILAKLALESRSQAAAYAIRNRLPELDRGRGMRRSARGAARRPGDAHLGRLRPEPDAAPKPVRKR